MLYYHHVVLPSCCTRKKCSPVCVLGSQDGRLHVWASDSGQKIATMDGNHPGPTKCVKFNPKFMMIASACTNMVSPGSHISRYSTATYYTQRNYI